MDEILLDMRTLFDGLKAEGLVPLDQVLNISINTEELPTLQGWRIGIVEQMLTSTKPTTTFKPTPMATQEEGELAGEPKLELELVPIPKGSGSPPPTVLTDMVATVRRILSENPHIASWYLSDRTTW